MEPVYYGLFHANSPALNEAVYRALASYGYVDLEEWGAFVRVQSLRPTRTSFSRTLVPVAPPFNR